MKILLTGSSGLLGKKLLETIPAGITLIPTYHLHNIQHKNAVQLDITNSIQTQHVIDTIRPDLVIHAASIVYVDECEKNRSATHHANVIGTKNIYTASKKNNVKLLFCSTNGIFDGKNPPYKEADVANPLHVYGKTKYEAEKLIYDLYKKNSIILRFNTMFGWNHPGARENPVTWLLQRLEKNTLTHMVTDIYNSHLWVGQATDTVWRSVEKKCYGEIFHVGGGDCLNRFQLSQLIATTFGYNKQLIKPVTSDFFPTIAPRPHNTCFDLSKMQSVLGIIPLSIIEGLKNMKADQS